MKAEVVLFVICYVLSTSFNLSTTASEDTSHDNYVLQQKKICGQYCLTSVLRYLGKNVEISDFYYSAPPEYGTNLAQLKQFAEAYELKTLGAKVSKEILFSMGRPAILHVNGNHFIALLPKKIGTNYTVIDPPQSFTITGPEELVSRWKWKGNCLFVDKKEIILPEIQEAGKGKILYYAVAIVLIFTILLICVRSIASRKAVGTSTTTTILPFLCVLVLINTSSCRNKRVQKASDGGVPRIFVADPVFDAGIVFDETNVIAHSFVVKNTGTADLLIEDIKTDCSCTTVGNVKKKLVPGESSPVTINFHLRGHFGKMADRKTVIVTNDPDNPTTLVTILAVRRREFTLSPPSALLGIVPMGMEKVLLMRITPGAEDKILSLDKISTSSNFIEVTPIDSEITSQKTKNYLLRVKLLPTAPGGMLNEVIHIPCLGASREMLEIPVRAEVKGPINASLSEVQFGLIKRQEKEKVKKVQLRSKKAFNIVKISTNQLWLKVPKEQISDKEFSLLVTITPAKASQGKLEGMITVETDLLDMNSIQIPVFAFHL
jgi:hypothetical protein